MIHEQERPNKTPWPVVNHDSIENRTPSGETIKVRCLAPEGLYYNFSRRREGDVFTLIPQMVTKLELKPTGEWLPVMKDGKPVTEIIPARKQLSPRTMEEVEPSEPEETTSAQGVLNKTQAEHGISPRRGR